MREIAFHDETGGLDARGGRGGLECIEIGGVPRLEEHIVPRDALYVQLFVKRGSGLQRKLARVVEIAQAVGLTRKYWQAPFLLTERVGPSQSAHRERGSA